MPEPMGRAALEAILAERINFRDHEIGDAPDAILAAGWTSPEEAAAFRACVAELQHCDEVSRGLLEKERARVAELEGICADWAAAHEVSKTNDRKYRANLSSRITELEAQRDRVRALHQPIDAVNMRHHPNGRLTRVCSGCGTDDGNWQHYPCSTVRALGENR